MHQRPSRNRLSCRDFVFNARQPLTHRRRLCRPATASAAHGPGRGSRYGPGRGSCARAVSVSGRGSCWRPSGPQPGPAYWILLAAWRVGGPAYGDPSRRLRLCPHKPLRHPPHRGQRRGGVLGARRKAVDFKESDPSHILLSRTGDSGGVAYSVLVAPSDPPWRLYR